jgi:sulfite dehydrogenase (cytochrome) subunit B
MRNKGLVIGLGLLALAAGGAAFTVLQHDDAPAPIAARMEPVSYQLPEETVPAALADAGAEAVVNNCSACHSLEYITTQPPGMGETFWHDEVAKMVKVYGAPIEPDQAEAIARILADRFG